MSTVVFALIMHVCLGNACYPVMPDNQPDMTVPECRGVSNLIEFVWRKQHPDWTVRDKTCIPRSTAEQIAKARPEGGTCRCRKLGVGFRFNPYSPHRSRPRAGCPGSTCSVTRRGPVMAEQSDASTAQVVSVAVHLVQIVILAVVLARLQRTCGRDAGR